MRLPSLLTATLFLLLALPLARAGTDGFGSDTAPTFNMQKLPGSPDAGEPTIGIPWNTGHVFMEAGVKTFRCVFGNGTPAPMDCKDVTPAFSKTNFDPMLHVDSVSNRIFQGGLEPACSIMGISDDDGQTWLPSRNMCTGGQTDHQSIGTGPWSKSAPESAQRTIAYPRAAYYCAQGNDVSVFLVDPGVGPAGAACTTSLDGGFTWLPFTEVLGGCGGYHGHIRVSEVDGFAVVPFALCGDKVGYAYSADNGVTWASATFPASKPGGSIGFDPSVNFGHTKGWMYFALANDLGLHVALSKDEGKTWQTVANSTPGVTPGAWVDILPAYADPQTGGHLAYATFTDVQVGDDDRVAIAFLGASGEGKKPFSCGADSDRLVWRYYLAQSFDAAQTWTVTKLSDDPVQVGGIFDGGAGGGDSSCRNLLDFNDMEMDAQGRLYIGFADGCIDKCAADAMAGKTPKPSDSRHDLGTLMRQESGRGLFAKEDVALGSETPAVTRTSAPEQPTPAPGVALVGLAVVAMALAARRRT